MPDGRWQTEVLRSKGFCGKIGGEPPAEQACILALDHAGRCGWAVDGGRLTEGDLQRLELHGSTTLDFNRLANEVRALWRENASLRAALDSMPAEGEVTVRAPRRRRLRTCVEAWPECVSSGYDPRCCRFPKSCSCEAYDDARVTDEDLEVMASTSETGR